MLIESLFALGPINHISKLRDTIVCSHATYAEIKRQMKKAAFEDRSTVLPSVAVPAGIIYYADDYGTVFKYAINVETL